MAEPRSKGEERDLLAEGKEAFQLAVDTEADNRKVAVDDIRFARLGEQWPEEIRKAREIARRPCLTTNMMNGFIRQVVNDSRQNKPSIKVHPVDDAADPKTAEIMNGLIRNIEYTSDADIAYDTATESAVSMGWGYFRIDYDYAFDDSADLDIAIHRVANPFSIYGDPFSTAADSSDWNTAFETDWLTEDAFKSQFPGEDKIDWDFDFRGAEAWRRDKEVLVAKWWRREEVERPLIILSTGEMIDRPIFEAQAGLLMASGILPVREHTGRSYKVVRHIMTGAKVIKSEDWLGKYIPIIPVYGDDVVDEQGKRHLRSLIHDGKDAQTRYNFHSTTSTEITALQPRVPWVGKKGAFRSDSRRWATANTENHAYLEYDGDQPPQRQPLDMGPAAGSLQEAAKALDDMRSTIGLHAASMGQPSNETSGKAILVRQREGDVSTFHFQDNMARAIRHAGRILIDLIPKIYNSERIIRIIGEDGEPENIRLKQPVPALDDNGQPIMGDDGQPVTRVYDLSLGKYDLTVTTGPSFTTKREEAAVQMTEYLRIWPQAAPIIGDLVAKNLDWPGADEIAKRLKKMLPPQLQEGGLPPEVQAKIEQDAQMIGQLQQTLQQMQAYILKLESDNSAKHRKVDVDEFNAQTKRMEAETDLLNVMSDDKGMAFEVPSTGTAEYAERIVAEAQANRLNASADKERAQAGLANAKAAKELQPDPLVDPRILHARRTVF